ncbi:hypothetical protein FB45DRAFT_347701 [Roridomyces roridus]|uniref:Uncharacterized protein n=1 Tax=Roridomyces roridus TaxID=1738132 RepID=A0AAD7F8X5_9AGAR|nr:hypothetical protein FB45DRAFT_347701 [Roridomyces roridus]
MDNAGNCNTTADHMVIEVPTFRGRLARGRCFLHILQLVAKMIISFFFKQPRRKKAIKANKNSVKRTTSLSADSLEPDETDEFVLCEADPSADAEDLELAEVIHEPEDDAPPTAQDVHDGKVTSTIRQATIAEMCLDGVYIDPAEEKDALKLFPKVAGLAKKVHDSRVIHAEFQRIVADPGTGLPTDSNVTELARRNATRWGSEYQCLQTRRIIGKAVDKLIQNPNLKLGGYAFNKRQGKLALELETLLEVIDIPSQMFQSKNRPLITEVLPYMDDLDYMLNNITEAHDLCDTTRVAACAGLRVLRKYFALLDECEAYRIAIVMCPDRKLQWFRGRKWDDAQIADLRSLVVRRFNESYKTVGPTASNPSMSIPPTSTAESLSGRFSRRPGVSNNSTTSEADNIHTYLDSPLSMPSGTVIQYWNERLTPPPGSTVIATPDLARFGLSFCSCPGKLSFQACLHIC